MRKNTFLILLLTFSIACTTANQTTFQENISKQNKNDSSTVSIESENKNLSSQNFGASVSSAEISNKLNERKSTDSSERIKFASGAISANVGGTLKDYEDAKSFVIEVKKGQTLSAEQVKEDDSLKYVTVAVQDPTGKYVGDSDASCNNRKEIKPTAAGNYHIKVKECMKADAWRGQFNLKVSVE